MPDITLLLALHNHQPVGNFGDVFEMAYERCYKPVLEAFYNAPGVRFSLHHTGPLLEWIAAHRADYLGMMKEMIQRNQLEVLGGGFYEPMLSVLPEQDALGQLRMMRQWCQENLDTTPRGMWLAERVWEPDLPRILAQGDMEFTLLDDTHFYNAGRTHRYLHSSYLVEKAGHTTQALPISKDLRYAIPFTEVDETIAILRKIATETGNQNIALTYGDDGEKFGLWPDTYAWVFDKGWLAEFLAALEENSSWLATSTISDYLDNNSPQGLIYLPTASYEEMGHWSLPTEPGKTFDDFRHELMDEGRFENHRAFVRGGIWQGFLTKYPESNDIHKRMLRVSRTLAQVEKDPTLSAQHPEEIAAARQDLYKGQCNCAYWHGLFGGIYLNWLRDGLYHHLLKAEATLAKILHGDTYRILSHEDFDLDGHKEYILETENLHLILCPQQGGALSDISLRSFPFNPTGVFTRKIEGFHRLLEKAVVVNRNQPTEEDKDGKPQSIHDLVLAKEEGLQRFVIEDPAPRFSAQEFLYPNAPLDSLVHDLRFGKIDPIDAPATRPFQVQKVSHNDQKTSIHMSQSGDLIDLQKTLESSDTHGFVVRYSIQARKKLEGLRFVSAFNLTLLAPDAPDRQLFTLGDPMPMNTTGAWKTSTVSLKDGWTQLAMHLQSRTESEVLTYPIETVNQSEDGFERTYQGTCVLFTWALDLDANQTQDLELRFSTEKL